MPISSFGAQITDPVYANRAPLVTDNTYREGQKWLDTVANKMYWCLDVTGAVATWSSPSGSGSTITTTIVSAAVTLSGSDSYSYLVFNSPTEITQSLPVISASVTNKQYGMANVNTGLVNVTDSAGVSLIRLNKDEQIYAICDSVRWIIHT